jgi:ssRNA-specific RNase YbeY (16S rRNA maturation enzyme)
MKDYPIEIFNEGSLKFEEGTILQIADFVRSSINTDFEVYIGWLNIIILKTDEHTLLNARHLGHDYPTDILTFEYDEEVVMNGEIYINEEVMVFFTWQV